MATKKKITDDWQQLFPELKKTKLLEMDNRLGPLITGIYLKVVRNTYYLILTIPYQEQVICYGYYTTVKNVKWFLVTYNDLTGYVSSEYLKKEQV